MSATPANGSAFPRPRRVRSILVWGNLVAVLLVANWVVFAKEDQLRNGRMVFLSIEIEKYDPRSLMQGDYMALTYPIWSEIGGRLGVASLADKPGEGLVVLGVDADHVGHLRRLHLGEPLAEDETLLRYRLRWGGRNAVHIAAEQYLFQEGLAKEYERARFAELRITPEGRTILVALCDSRRRRIGEKSD